MPREKFVYENSGEYFKNVNKWAGLHLLHSHNRSAHHISPHSNIKSGADNMVADDDDNPCCWICLAEGPNEEGEPLLNGRCSCRGSAGYFHLDCVTEHAKSQTKSAVESSSCSHFDERVW